MDSILGWHAHLYKVVSLTSAGDVGKKLGEIAYLHGQKPLLLAGGDSISRHPQVESPYYKLREALSS